MVGLNDEVIGRLTDQAFEGEIILGVPHDIVYPAIPRVLKRFSASYPRVRVQLIASYTRRLKDLFAKGECDMILTTEAEGGADCETLTRLPLCWVGAPGGAAWRRRPIRLAFGRQCMFRPKVIAALNEAGVPWELAVETDSDRTIEATVSADLAVHVVLEGTEPPQLERIDHGGALPELPAHFINLYGAEAAASKPVEDLVDLLRDGFRPTGAGRMRAVG